ncbi:cytoplasmic copper homeostasis protein cutC [Klebsiella pneumoniae]|nr:cytoplasmic copper homeostasis protein cutC [Klebsiella pneumoniae]
MAVLEVCCYSMACAREAERCGADRIELCAAPQEGGLTPSYGVLVSAREAITLPVHPIVRPARRRFLLHRGRVRRDA